MMEKSIYAAGPPSYPHPHPNGHLNWLNVLCRLPRLLIGGEGGGVQMLLWGGWEPIWIKKHADNRDRFRNVHIRQQFFHLYGRPGRFFDLIQERLFLVKPGTTLNVCQNKFLVVLSTELSLYWMGSGHEYLPEALSLNSNLPRNWLFLFVSYFKKYIGIYIFKIDFCIFHWSYITLTFLRLESTLSRHGRAAITMTQNWQNKKLFLESSSCHYKSTTPESLFPEQSINMPYLKPNPGQFHSLTPMGGEVGWGWGWGWSNTHEGNVLSCRNVSLPFWQDNLWPLLLGEN